ncbi:DNA-binding MarR family transcriptional regulator [Herbihabitans rhizosphaerae]|uniref:DNA-binding MarR family transcriptional regulator n=1 Tax=Herbihabitans rhizosphaerae TaxID=1872711 RepID=A0A4Q7KEE4_9PSEU|nr:MarR family transcriptional regulator [Herbihabitans rhizosphaerae]RZS31210.1 DNA-binding MarR family transcriptional regulator [Herbihabitans rhizosphaerae]
MDDQCPDDRVWRTYIETSIRLQTRLDDDLRATAGMSLIDYHVLLLLAEAPDCRMRMGELAARMVFSSSRLTYQVKAMEERGWVLRQQSSADRRVSHAVLTASGFTALRDAGEHHGRTVRELFTNDLDDEELRVLRRVFERVAKRLDG